MNKNDVNVISIDDFARVSLRVGTIISCNRVEKSNKLLALEVDFGELGVRQILTGMAEYYKPEDFAGLQTVFVFNLAPRKMMGLESHGMLLSVGVDHDQKPLLLKISETAKNGDGLS